MTIRLIFRQLYPAILIVIAVSLLGLISFTRTYLRKSYYEQKQDQARTAAGLIAEQIVPLIANQRQDELEEVCRTLGFSGRMHISVVTPNGQVIADSHEPLSTASNQKNLPEITQALKLNAASDVRYHPLLKEEALYYAAPLDLPSEDFAVLRVAVGTQELEEMLASLTEIMIAGGALAALAAAVICIFFLNRLHQPIEQVKQIARHYAEGDLGHRILLPNSAGMNDLAESLNDMARRLDRKLQGIIEQRNELEAVLSSMVEGVLAVDMNEKIVSINQAAADLLGVESDKVAGHSVQEIIRNPDLQEFVAETLNSDGSVEASIVWPRGEESFFQLHGTGLTNSRNERYGAVIVLNDMTRLKRLENIRRDFVANVSHELKTPITSIKGFVETLQEGQFEDMGQMGKFLGIIGKQTDRLHAIIEDLLSLSRIEEDSEKGRIMLQTESIRAVIEAAVELSQVQARNKNITIIQEGDDITAPINSALMEQAVVNLVDNGIKYSRENDVVRIITRVVNSQVVISVKDNGCGIAEELLPRIFERFYVVDKARSRKLGGTGLGLAIVKHIAQAHGGFVTVQSWPGEGSTFNIHIPMPKEASMPSETTRQENLRQSHV